MTTTNETTTEAAAKRQPAKEATADKAAPAKKQAPSAATPKATVQPDAALIARYEKATDAQKAKLLLKVLADNDNKRSDTRRALGHSAGWTQREAKRLGVTLPATTRGRPASNGATATKPARNAPAAKRQPAKATKKAS